MNVNINKQQFEDITKGLSHEPWFHGKLNRATAESYIIDNGQFLVRQSPNINAQIVLSGMQNGIVKHICLVDHEGSVSIMLRGVQIDLRFFLKRKNVMMILFEPKLCKRFFV